MSSKNGSVEEVERDGLDSILRAGSGWVRQQAGCAGGAGRPEVRPSSSNEDADRRMET